MCAMDFARDIMTTSFLRSRYLLPAYEFLEQQVCSLDLAKQLKVFGVKQDVGFVWALADTDRSNGEWMIFERRRCWLEGDVAAFTVAELGEMLPSPRNDHEWLRFIKRGSKIYPCGKRDTRPLAQRVNGVSKSMNERRPTAAPTAHLAHPE